MDNSKFEVITLFSENEDESDNPDSGTLIMYEESDENKGEYRAEPIEGSIDDNVLKVERLSDRPWREQDHQANEANEANDSQMSDDELEENEEDREIPGDHRIVAWLRKTYQTGTCNQLVRKQALFKSFYRYFNLNFDFNHHFVVTRIGGLVYQTFPQVKEARPGTAAHGYRAPHYRYLKLRST